MISTKTIQIIKQITPVVAQHGETITRCFYKRMFEANPEVKAFFNSAHQASGGQQRALAGAIAVYFSHIDNLEVLVPAIELIAQKHCSLGIKPEHYPIVGKHLLDAIKEVLGDAATDEIITAVAESYQVLANVCIGREAAIYQEQRSQPGGWNGYRNFKVIRKTAESASVMSIYMQPEDGQAIPTFRPGQYITIQVNHPSVSTSPRNYSLSECPKEAYYRISVKRERALADGAPDGLVSSYLHDTVQVGDVLHIGPPCGDFFVDVEATKAHHRPIVFVAGGIGITPLLCMAKSLVNARVQNSIYFIHAVRDRDQQIFEQEIRELVEEGSHVSSLTLFDCASDEDLQSGRCHREGRISAELLKELVPLQESEFYCCGPKPFMQASLDALLTLGVSGDRMHFEFFGPKQEFANAAV